MSTIAEMVQGLKGPRQDDAAGYALFQKLTRLKDDGVHDALVDLARTPCVHSQDAADALEKRARKGDARALQALAVLATEGAQERLVPGRCVSALGRFKEEVALTRLIELCEPASPVRMEAVITLQERVHRDKSVRGDKRIAAAFLGAIGDPRCRTTAIHGVRLTGDERALDVLVRYLEDENVDVRVGVVMALSALGDRAAIAPLKAYRDRAPEGERVSVDRAIEKLESGK
jgi:HEAT repeat protein